MYWNFLYWICIGTVLELYVLELYWKCIGTVCIGTVLEMYWNSNFIRFLFPPRLEICFKGNNVRWRLRILFFHEYSVVSLSVVWDDGAV